MLKSALEYLQGVTKFANVNLSNFLYSVYRRRRFNYRALSMCRDRQRCKSEMRKIENRKRESQMEDVRLILAGKLKTYLSYQNSE